MQEKQYSRRECFRAAAAGGLGAIAVAGTRPAQAAPKPLPEVKIAGYAYDRVRAIQDGQLGSLYSRAKQAAYEDLETVGVLKVTLPWVHQELEDTRALMGDNYWKYGVDANRKELELVMRYTHEQGLAKRRLTVDEIFHPSTLKLHEA